jgi:hypothetical protein
VLIRRISGHVKEQNWFAVWLDLVIVFVAVFIGLQADNWNQQRVANETAKTYYARLIADLQAEQDSRDARAVYYERTKRHAEAALDALRTSGQNMGKEFLIHAYQATQRWNYAPQRTTYDELIGAGIANAIPDVEIRSRLANLYLNLIQSKITLEEPTPFRDKLRHEMLHEVQSIIRERCGDRYLFLENSVYHLELPEVCDLEIEASLVEKAVRALLAYEDLAKDLAHQVSILDGKLGSLRATEQPIQEMIDLLAAQ